MTGNGLKLKPEVKHQLGISILADSTSQFFVRGMLSEGLEKGIEFDAYESDFDQIEQEIRNRSSEFHQRQDEYVILLLSTEGLLSRFLKLGREDRSAFAEDYLANLEDLVGNINAKSRIILNTFPQINSGIYGNYSAKLDYSFEYQLSKLNYKLKELSLSLGNVFICDIEQLQSLSGYSERIDPKFYISSSLCFSLGFTQQLVSQYISIIKASKGIELKKCLILDLDNTIWGGVIGDDGVEGIQLGSLGLGKAFSDLQLWAKELKQRGIILCVCSKNNEDIAKEPFEQHPDMILGLDDIAVFVASWENKADGIREIASILNIGFDSMVFLDDNPFERNFVRTELPDVMVPELPEDPVEYMPYIRSLNLFETAMISDEDANRAKKYKEEATRVAVRQSYKSMDDYLKSLKMKADVKPFDNFSAPRVAQLTQRSNQFNLRTVRYTEEEIVQFSSSSEYMTLTISLSDAYGDYGLISVIIGKIVGDSLFIDTWIMSCRVLKRDVEKFALNQIIERCQDLGLLYVKGEYIETPKNALVEEHYGILGFDDMGDNNYQLRVDSYKNIENSIERV